MKSNPIIIIILGLSILLALIFGVLVLHELPAYAANLNIQSGVQAAKGDGVATDLFGSTGVFTTISNVLLFAIGALSVIMIIIGGLRYIVSGGNSAAVTGAKNTILYAIIGLVVAFLAYAAINFVMDTLIGGSGTNV